MTTSPVVTITEELIAELERSVECVWPETDHAVVTLRALLAERAELKDLLETRSKELKFSRVMSAKLSDLLREERALLMVSKHDADLLRVERAELKRRADQGDWLIEYMASEREDLDDTLMEGCSDNQPHVLRSIIDAAMQAAK